LASLEILDRRQRISSIEIPLDILGKMAFDEARRDAEYRLQSCAKNFQRIEAE